MMQIKILDSENLDLQIRHLRDLNPQIRIVLCHGVFDLVHPGHLEHFEKAKKFGDTLVVSITGDQFINKGPGRPYFDQTRRAKFLSSLELVDYVYIDDSDSALNVISIVKPNLYVKGPDYKNLHEDITGKILKEKEAVEKFGGQLTFTDGFTSSSTRLINSAFYQQDSDLGKWLQLFKSKFSSSDVFEWIDKLATIEVNILGETIIDVYTECRPLAKSSKDPILAFQRYETRKFLGGVLAIAASCSEWAAKTRVFSACGEDFTNHLSEISKEIRFLRNFVELHDRPTIVKHRYVDKVSGNRIFEYYDFKPDTIGEDFQEKVIELLGELRQQKALLLLADYGHGFFGSKLIDSLFESNAFLSVNTQSNAGNRGFNTFSKYPRIDFLCLNGAELELELRKKDLNYGFVVPQIMNDKGCRYAVVTLGADGLLTFDSNGESCHTPALASRVVDKVGAGDSVLAVASMLAFLSAPKEIIGLLASVVAAFEVSQLGHANSISAVNMKKYVNGLLG